jgi:hypothetical protein
MYQVCYLKASEKGMPNLLGCVPLENEKNKDTLNFDKKQNCKHPLLQTLSCVAAR